MSPVRVVAPVVVSVTVAFLFILFLFVGIRWIIDDQCHGGGGYDHVMCLTVDGGVPLGQDVKVQVSIISQVMSVYYMEGVKGFCVGRGLQLEEEIHCVTQQVDWQVAGAY